MFKLIYKHLEAKGFMVYSIGQHQGVCAESYVVIKENSKNPISFSITNDIIDIIMFCPQGAYTGVADYVNSVRAALKELKELKFTNEITPIVLDNDKRAYTASMKYQNYKRRDE